MTNEVVANATSRQRHMYGNLNKNTHLVHMLYYALDERRYALGERRQKASSKSGSAATERQMLINHDCRHWRQSPIFNVDAHRLLMHDIWYVRVACTAYTES